MELKQAIENRRSIRHYKEMELKKEQIQDILNYGVLAPSAHNRNPWRFIVIHENQELKKEIADTLRNKSDASTNLTCEVIDTCSALVLVYADIEEEIFDVQSVGACIENMLLRATDLGISSLWIGYILKIEEELKRKFETDKKLIAAIALGYSDVFPKPRPRKSLEEVSVWY